MVNDSALPVSLMRQRLVIYILEQYSSSSNLL